jgi:hypothetical protein
MPWRNLGHDATSLHFVGNLSARPLTDGASRFGRGFAVQGCHLTSLLRAKGWSHPRARCILQSLSQAQGLLIDPLEACPAISPQTCRIHVNTQITSNLRIVVFLSCCYYDPRPEHNLPFTSVY